MNTKSFVDAYEQMIKRHNNNVMNADDHSSIIKEADNEEKGEDQEDLQLDDDQEEEQNIQDEEEQLESDEQDDFDLDLNDEDLEDEPQSETNPEDLNSQNEVAFNFPDPLLTEFINTVNQFTRLCANVVQNKSVTVDKSKNLDKLIGKIKNLLQAAEKSV